MSKLGTYLAFFCIIAFLGTMDDSLIISIAILAFGILACVLLKVKAKDVAARDLQLKIMKDWVFAETFANDHPEYRALCIRLNPTYASKRKEQDEEYRQGLENIHQKHLTDLEKGTEQSSPDEGEPSNKSPSVMDLYRRSREEQTRDMT